MKEEVLEKVRELDREVKVYILERNERNNDESHEETKVRIEEAYPTEELLNGKLISLSEADTLVYERISYAYVFKKVPSQKYINQSLIDDVISDLEFSTNVIDQLELENTLRNLLEDDASKVEIKDLIEQYVLDENPEIDGGFLNVYVEAHFINAMHQLLFEETEDFYTSIAKHIKKPTAKFSIHLNDESKIIEILRVLYSTNDKTMNNSQLFRKLLDLGIKDVEQDSRFGIIAAIVGKVLSKKEK